MMVSDENELFFIDLDLGGPNYCAFDIMKLFRTSKEITSVKKEEHLKAFLEIYCKVLACNISPKGKTKYGRLDILNTKHPSHVF